MASLSEKIAHCLSLTAQSIASLLKVALRSRRPSKGNSYPQGELVILGNGPSLRAAIDNSTPFLLSKTRLAVNFAANATSDFQKLRPQLYVLADPHFFTGADTDPNVANLWHNLSAAPWPITLYLPCKYRRHPLALQFAAQEHKQLRLFNLTPSEGFPALCHSLYRKGLAMPRPRNVLIPSIMIALREGFSKIYLTGADHSWTRTLDVDQDNRVVSIQPHFYKDNNSEQKRVATEYTNYHLHDILKSLYIAFASYHRIAQYARRRNVQIINSTPDSMIDAFPRQPLPTR